MRPQLRPLFWVEAGLACLSASALLLTLLWADWIEIVFGVDPDNHTGSLEWLIVVGCLCATVLLAGFARQEWRKTVSVG